jgi:photosystem II stability/assembly factor-like uncharacterized protein
MALAVGLALPASAWAGWETPAWEADGAPVAAPSIRQVVRDPGGDLLAATSAGLFRSTDDGRRWRREADAPVAALNAVAATDDAVWVAEEHGHLYGSGDAGDP